MLRLLTVIAVSIGVVGRLSAQSLSGHDIHDQLTRVIAQVSDGRLPVGDTSVTWRPDSPILYHTAERTPSLVRTGMARNDGLVGALETRWETGSVTAFTSRWSRRDSVEVEWVGTVTAQGIQIHGRSRDTLLTVPQMRWLVADYAMEDQFVPLFASLRVGDSIPVAVLRPYQLKWDTVAVVVGGTAGTMRVRLIQGPPAPLELLLAFDATILRISRGSEYERRPLETTARYRQYQSSCRPKPTDGRALTSVCS